MNSASAPIVADARETRAFSKPDASPLAESRSGWPVAFLGVPFDHITMVEVMKRIDAMIATRRPHYLVSANMNLLVRANRDAELRRILIDADLVLGEGTLLRWASRWHGNTLPESLRGADLAQALVRAAAEKGHRVFLLGGPPGAAAEAEARLKKQFPMLKLAGTLAPPSWPPGAMNDDEIIHQVRAAHPDLVLISFGGGGGKQEKWVATHFRALGAPVVIGVTAAIPALAGQPQRAQKRFLSTMNALASFTPMFFGQWWRLAIGRKIIARPQEVSFAMRGWCSIDAGIRLTRRSLERDASFWREIPTRLTHCLVNVSKVRRIDGTGLAYFIRWRKVLFSRGRQLVLLAPSPVLRRALAITGLSGHFVIANDVAQATQYAESLLDHATVQRDGTMRSLAWCGEIIASNTDDVWRMTTDHILAFAANRATLVIVDLSRLRFIDSSGAGLMLRLKKWSQQIHTEIFFAHPQENIRNVLRLTQIDQLLLEGGQ